MDKKVTNCIQEVLSEKIARKQGLKMVMGIEYQPRKTEGQNWNCP
jgi:hypothetical protein